MHLAAATLKGLGEFQNKKSRPHFTQLIKKVLADVSGVSVKNQINPSESLFHEKIFKLGDELLLNKAYLFVYFRRRPTKV